MERHFGGAAAVAVAVVLLLSSCGGQRPDSGGSDSESQGTASQQPPRTTAAQPSTASSPPGPQPSETSTPGQFETTNMLIGYHRIRNAVPSDLNADPRSLMDITVDQSREVRANRLSEFHGRGQIQTDTMVVRITGTSEPVEFGGVRSVDARTYTDTGKVDVIDPATSKSVVPADWPRYLQWNVSVVEAEVGWKFGGTTNKNALRCPA